MIPSVRCYALLDAEILRMIGVANATKGSQEMLSAISFGEDGKILKLITMAWIIIWESIGGSIWSAGTAVTRQS